MTSSSSTREVPSPRDVVPECGEVRVQRDRLAVSSSARWNSLSRSSVISPISLQSSPSAEEDPVALEEVAAKAVEDVEAAESEPQKVASPRTSIGTVILETDEAQSPDLSAVDVLCMQVLPLLQYLDRKREKYAKGSTIKSYVEVVCSRTRAKVAVTAEVAAKKRRSQLTESKYQALHRRLAEEVEKQRTLEKSLEASRTAYDAEALRVDELVATVEKKEWEYTIELAAREKKLAKYKTARVLDLELIEKQEAQCSELRTQRLQAEEQLCELEARLTEAEGKNRHLSEETREALTARVERCLRGYVLWQIKSHNELWLREIEHCAAELIARSGRRHRRLSKKLESYLTRSRDAVANLEVTVLVVRNKVVQGIGLGVFSQFSVLNFGTLYSLRVLSTGSMVADIFEIGVQKDESVISMVEDIFEIGVQKDESVILAVLWVFGSIAFEWNWIEDVMA
ncbi:hypothetical protein AXG93_1976s1500 [Marchantia polymorpha subsp. ruderalis]|uniref:Uncharacterized protein n=1 Tax=Marchantia polymorpha subsp. ruderalis TaxID=1480154 RepID=A0A176VER1_MARPO|nr:hypothetical protein AXG93_1976s1500 [Marchantia polymorpha subsp. ruderalis]